MNRLKLFRLQIEAALKRFMMRESRRRKMPVCTGEQGKQLAEEQTTLATRLEPACQNIGHAGSILGSFQKCATFARLDETGKDANLPGVTITDGWRWVATSPT